MREFDPVLKIYTSETIPAPYEHQIRSFARIQWVDAYQRNLNPPLGNPDYHPLHFVLVEGDALYSAARVNQKMLDHQGQSYRVYGLGTVFTYPAFRQRGYGAWVVGAASDHIRQQADADIGILWTQQPNIPFYQRHGWEHLPQAQINLGDPAHPYRSTEEVLMLFVSQRAKSHRHQFEQHPVYFGRHAW